MSSITFAALQYSCTDHIAQNVDKAEGMIADAAKQGANIIALQELFHTPYFCRETNSRFFDWAEPVPGGTTLRFSTLARQLGVVLLLPLFERKAAGVYFNTLVVIEADGSIAGKYRKMHIPDDPGFYEKYYFTPGDTGFKVFKTRFGTIGTLICWDQWFPEAARLSALQGADLLVYPTAIGTLAEETASDKAHFLDAWKTIQRSHAIANGCFLAAVNRTGTEGETTFWGNSFICGPFGEMLAEAGEEEEIIYAGIDFSTIENQRQTWPFFRDRRIDAYEGILKRWSTE